MKKAVSPKIVWRVSEKPTGMYRSFARRGWPVGSVSGQTVFIIICADDYVPRNVREGKHGLLTLRIADRRHSAQFTWRFWKKKFKTLDEAKLVAKAFLEKHPEFLNHLEPEITK